MHDDVEMRALRQDGVFGKVFVERRRAGADGEAGEWKRLRGLSKPEWALVDGIPGESRELVRDPIEWKFRKEDREKVITQVDGSSST